MGNEELDSSRGWKDAPKTHLRWESTILWAALKKRVRLTSVTTETKFPVTLARMWTQGQI